jgi:putative ABC transport system permease protein
MFMHLIKTLWKRKTKNLLLSLEILLIFCVIFTVVVGVMYNANLFRTPLGYDIADRWRVTLKAASDKEEVADPQLVDNYRRSLLAMPEVESISFVQATPYLQFGLRSTFTVQDRVDRQYSTAFLSLDDEASKALNIPLAEGRWFSSADESSGLGVAVLNRRMANTMFPNQNPIGKIIAKYGAKEGKKNQSMYKIVGVVEQYRYLGDYTVPENLILLRHSSILSAPLDHIVIKVKAGTARNFEIKLNRQLKMVRNDAEFRISTLTEERADYLSQKMMFYVPPVIISLFLLVMVAFGLFGVLWQNTTSRTPEIGLRRAIGASSADIYTQIMLEQALLCSLAMAVAFVFLVQLPFTGVAEKYLTWGSFFQSIGISMLIIYTVSIICSLYPAWLASRLSPTVALHYE